MENNDDRGYGMCSFCKSPNVINPHTGKVFCSQKCWNNKGKKIPEKQELPIEVEARLANIEVALERVITTLEYFCPELGDWVDERIWKKYGSKNTSYKRLVKDEEKAEEEVDLSKVPF